MIKFVVCDDLPLSSHCVADAIESIANNYDIEYEIIYFDNINKFLNNILNNEYDIYFIDIDMPEMRGDKVARYVKMTHPFATVSLLSMYENFGDIACSAMVDGYLYKSYRPHYMMTQVIRLLKICSNKKKRHRFKTNDSEIDIAICDIMYIESLKRKLYVHLQNKSIINVYKETLKSLKQNIEFFNFYKISRSCLVNIESVEFIDKNNYTIELKSGDIIDLRSDVLMNKFKKLYGFFRDSYRNECTINEADIENLKK